VGECFFWYRPTRVVPDQRPLNGRCCNTAVRVYELKNILQSREIFLYKLPGESHNDYAFINDLWPTIIIIIIIKHIYIAQVRKVHKCAMLAEMAAWLRNCLCLYSYLHN